MRLTICLGVLVFALVAPRAMASAANCAAPPGTSGIDEYCEVLPTAGGPTHHTGHKGGSKQVDKVPATTRKALQKQGDAGAAVLALTQSAPSVPTRSTPSSTPVPAKPHTHRKHTSQSGGGSQQQSTTSSQSTPQKPVAPAPAAPASNPVSAVGDSFGGSVGAGFLVLLAAIAAVMALVAWLGRRRRPDTA